jgi:hypothetical protein
MSALGHKRTLLDVRIADAMHVIQEPAKAQKVLEVFAQRLPRLAPTPARVILFSFLNSFVRHKFL